MDVKCVYNSDENEQWKYTRAPIFTRVAGSKLPTNVGPAPWGQMLENVGYSKECDVYCMVSGSL